MGRRNRDLTMHASGTALMKRPNGLAFSCRERAGRRLQNANDLAREAVNCNIPWAGAHSRPEKLPYQPSRRL